MARSSDSNFLLAIVRDKTFQAREVRRVIKLSLVYLLVTTVLLGVFYNHMLGEITSGSSPLLFASEDMALVNEAIPPLGAVLVRWLIIMMVINVLVTAAVSIYIMRKLGHPLLAMRRALREVAAGNLDVRLRENDSKDFGELSNELKAALAVVRNQVADAKASIDEANGDNDAALEKARRALSFFSVDAGAHSANDNNNNDNDSSSAA